MNGIIIVDKPKDWTSQDVVTKIKRVLKTKKVGHAGTLDPLATGVLVVLVNGATKLSDYLMADNKEYDCNIVIGKATTTEDVMGEVVSSKSVTEDLINVDEVLTSLKGKLSQVPPMYSSLHHNGAKLYELARMGITVERDAREIEIFDIKRTSEVIYFDGLASFDFRAKVSKGTYIRTLCCEIGARLNYPAYMNELRRISSGNLHINDACTIDDIINDNYKLISMLDALENINKIEVDEDLFKKINNGMKVKLDCSDEEVLLTKNNELIAIYEKEDQVYRAKRVWN